MIFGSLNEVFNNTKTLYQQADDVKIIDEGYSGQSNKNFNSYNKYNYSATQPSQFKQSKISKFLKLFSNYGMDYNKKLLQNMQAVPANPAFQKKSVQNLQNLYGMPNLDWKVKAEEDKPFSEKTLNEKRQILRRMAEQPEIEDILDIMCNECIVYDSNNNYICTPFLENSVIQDLNENALNEIRASVNSNFYKIYMLEDLKNIKIQIRKGE